MKKFLSLLLVAMMLLSCASAMAAEKAPTDNTLINNIKDISTLTVAENEVHFDVDEKNNTATQKTDLWLKVEASGQIDVTVPLVLVFSTNIDGGDATVTDQYKIINNNNTNLVVTEVKMTPNANTTENPMKLVGKETTTLKDNEYFVTLYAQPTDTDANDQTVFDMYDLDTVTANQQQSVSKLAGNGGLFKLNRTNDGTTTASETDIEVYMKTGKLDFVTTYKWDSQNNEVQNKDHGVHLLTVNYTIAINSETSYGKDIASASTGATYGSTTYEAGNQVDMNVAYTTDEAGTTTVTETK